MKTPLFGLQNTIVNLHRSGISVRDIASQYNVSRQAIYDLLKRAEKQGEKIAWKTKQPRFCEVCNKEIKSYNKTCGKKCQKKMLGIKVISKNSKWSKHIYVDLKCHKCGKDFRRTRYQDMISSIKPARKGLVKKNYCSLNCYRTRNVNN